MDRPNSERKRRLYTRSKPTPALCRMVKRELFAKLQVSKHNEHHVAQVPENFSDWAHRIFGVTGLDFNNLTYSEIASAIILCVFENLPTTTKTGAMG